MKRWLEEPLVHFLAAGALLFTAYAWLDRGAGDEPRIVRITAQEVNWLAETWSRQWQRPPSEDELRGLVVDYLKETLLEREARELGLDENDTIVRRRLAQKMEFLVQDIARLDEPGEEELRQFYEASPERYEAPARVSFTQLFFQTEAAARKGLAELAARGAGELGERSLLEREFTGADARTVESQFGPEFAGQVFALEPGWHGPVVSAYGFHLVRITESEAAQQLPFDGVRPQLLEDWHRVRQDQAEEEFLASLLEKYDVVLDDQLKPLVGSLTGTREGRRE